MRRRRTARRRWSAFPLLLILAAAGVAFPSPSAARVLEHLETSTGRTFAIARPEVRGIENFAEIEPDLARGARPTDEGLLELKARGFRTVVGLREDGSEREKLARLGIDYIEIPLHAGAFGASPPSNEQIRKFLEIVSDPARRPLFFHCRRGRDRTGAMAAIYRIERHGWRAAEAVEEMRAFGFASYYKRLLRFVGAYTRGSPARQS